MGTFTRPVDLAKHMERRMMGVKLTINHATKVLAEEGAQDMRSQMVGSLTEKDLRRMRHPYARMARILNIASMNGNRGFTEGKVSQISSRGRVSDLPFNSWTGRLRGSVTLQKKTASTWDLFDTAPQAKYLLKPDGTKYMRGRGLLGKAGILRKRWKFRQNGMVEALRKGHKRTP